MTPRNDPNPDVPFEEDRYNGDDDWMIYILTLMVFAAAGLAIYALWGG